MIVFSLCYHCDHHVSHHCDYHVPQVRLRQFEACISSGAVWDSLPISEKQNTESIEFEKLNEAVLNHQIITIVSFLSSCQPIIFNHLELPYCYILYTCICTFQSVKLLYGHVLYNHKNLNVQPCIYRHKILLSSFNEYESPSIDIRYCYLLFISLNYRA